MSTPSTVLTPEQEFILNNEVQDLSPQYTKVISHYLHHAAEKEPDPKIAKSLKSAALRVDLCSTKYQDHQLRSGKIVKQNLNPCHEGSLCDNCAPLQAAREFDRYRALEKLVGDEFTTLYTPMDRFPQVEELLAELKAPVLTKTGWVRGQFVAKTILLLPARCFPYAITQAIRKAAPTILIDCHGSGSFLEELRKVVRPDLPPDIPNRLKLKLMKRKLVFSGVNQETRKKLFDKERESKSNNFSEEEPDSGPCHMKDCVAHTEPYQIGTPGSELIWHYHGPPAKQRVM